jgi:RIO kinase 1
VDDTLRALLSQNQKQLESSTADEKRQQEIDDKVFRNVYIPRTLQEMSLEELDKLQKAGSEEEVTVARELRGIQGLSLSEDEDAEGEDSEGEEAEGESKQSKKKKKFDLFEGLSKKERKQKVKEEKREKRKNKIPKKVKKMMTKKTTK